jgi:hypothetical protein
MPVITTSFDQEAYDLINEMREINPETKQKENVQTVVRRVMLNEIAKYRKKKKK